uniref:uncharacterized protein LOC132660932 n=1 Tax=Panthera onca TaxID=9690 RepID=UPI002952D6F5|nr:uncharacterized protein LOC132660932 [Panthera onca]
MRREPPRNGFLLWGAGTKPEPARIWIGRERGQCGAVGSREQRWKGSGEGLGRWWGKGRAGGWGGTPARPYLVREQLLLSGAGAGDPGHIHVPAARRGSARRPPPLTLHALHRDGRPSGVGSGEVTGTARLQHLLQPLTPRLSLSAPAPGAATASGRPVRPRLRPAPRANQARHRPSRHRPARPAAQRPKFGEGRAPICLRVGAGESPSLVLLLTSGDHLGPPGLHVGSKGLSRGKGTPGSRLPRKNTAV